MNIKLDVTFDPQKSLLQIAGQAWSYRRPSSQAEFEAFRESKVPPTVLMLPFDGRLKRHDKIEGLKLDFQSFKLGTVSDITVPLEPI